MLAPANVLFCETNTDGTIGGSYYSLLYLVKGLDRSRYRPTVVFYTDHNLVEAFREAGADPHILPRPKPFTFGNCLPGLLKWMRLPALFAQKALNFVSGYVVTPLKRARFLRANDIRIVHLNNSIKYNHDWMAAAMLVGSKCVTHERGIHETYPAIARFFGRRLDAVICISRAVFDNLRSRGASEGNLVTIYNGLDPRGMRLTTTAAALRAQFGIQADATAVVMIGNIKAWKGQDTVVRAMPEILRACPSVRCVFVGDTSATDRGYERTLRALVSELDLDEHVIFAGYQAVVADFLNMSDIVVHASVLPEPFGRVLLEAMACRKPIVGARGGAVTELVVEGKTGLTFSPGDSDQLANAVIHLGEHPDEARRLGERGYLRLLEQFHIDRNVASTERLYASILGEAGSCQ